MTTVEAIAELKLAAAAWAEEGLAVCARAGDSLRAARGPDGGLPAELRAVEALWIEARRGWLRVFAACAT